MRVVIAEKPSLGRSIAEGIGARFEPVRDGNQVVALKSSNVTVTWAFGHILEMAPPQHYDERLAKWRLEDLPIVPKHWALVEKVPQQLKVIRGLLRKANEVVHAGDPDREGQLLIDEILHYVGWRGKTLRMLPHATDPQSIRKAWGKLEPNERYQPLYEAALCRQRADWLVGMNASRAATLLLTAQNQLVPIGRVMTPTLALVVRRDREIESFVSRPFWAVVAHCRTSSGQQLDLVHDPQPHIFDRAQAARLARSLKGRAVVLSVATKEVVERAPLPWHLGDFQRAMQKMHGMNLQRSLDVLQSLYEKQLVSYPRTECRYLPEEQKGDAVRILSATLQQALPAPEASAVQALREQWRPKDYIYDNAKVAEHHGIVPTGKVPKEGSLTPQEHAAWVAVVRHFAKTLLPHHRYEETEVSFEHEGARFVLKGKRSLNMAQSWRVLEPVNDALLPSVADGEQALVEQVGLKEGKTTPPQRYTEASLAADMEAIAKYVTDERIKAKLKETSGIGTAATRAAIIEKLKQKGMLQTRKEGRAACIVSTPFGREVVDALPATLTDPGLTAVWEEALQQIAQSQYDAGMFMQRIEHTVTRLIARFREQPRGLIKSAPQARSAQAPSGTKRKVNEATERLPRRSKQARSKQGRSGSRR